MSWCCQKGPLGVLLTPASGGKDNRLSAFSAIKKVRVNQKKPKTIKQSISLDAILTMKQCQIQIIRSRRTGADLIKGFNIVKRDIP